jgi:hypothetical protein
MSIFTEETLALYLIWNLDTIIIEQMGIAFPEQIKGNIENVEILEINFVPIVNFVDIL